MHKEFFSNTFSRAAFTDAAFLLTRRKKKQN